MRDLAYLTERYIFNSRKRYPKNARVNGTLIFFRKKKQQENQGSPFLNVELQYWIDVFEIRKHNFTLK